MRRLAAVFILVSIIACHSQAAIQVVIVSGDKVVYDDVAALYWYPLMQNTKNLTYTESDAFVDTLVYAGISDWTIPVKATVEGLDLNLDSIIVEAFEDAGWIPAAVSEGSQMRTSSEGGPGTHFVSGMPYEGPVLYVQLTSRRDSDVEHRLVAWATAPAVNNPIPEPTTLAIWSLLATLGLSVGWRRRRRA